MQAYSACVYVKRVRTSAVLLCSKSRVASLKYLSLSRLELCRAMLLVKLMNKVVASLKIKSCKTYY